MRCASVTRAVPGISATFLALVLATVPAAYAAPQGRISTNFTSGARVEIADSVHPRALSGADLGPAPDQMKLAGMSLRFSLSDAQSAALDQLLADQQNAASPRYRQWLTPTQFGAQFGLSDADIATVTAWLTAQGFSVTGVSNGRTFVTFDGTVSQANAAFGTSIHKMLSNGETHFTNVTGITLPAALGGVVSAVTGLHDFRAHPHLGGIAQPQFTSSQSGNHFVTPGDVNTIYDVKPLLNGGFTGAGIGTGANCHSIPTGTTCGDIAVLGQVDLYNNSTSDVVAFRQAAGLNTTNLPVTVHEGGDPGQAQTCSGCFPNTGDLSESSLDVEWSGAMAPGASILFVNGPDIMLNSLTQAIDQNLAPILTLSYGNCEAGWGSAYLNSFNQLFKQAASQGQTLIASSGDNGATDCDQGAVAVEGLTVDFPSTSPYVLSLGGTMFNGDAAGTGSGTTWSATPYWSGTSGTDVVSSAQGYIPEVVWNEDATAGSVFAGGGGVSNFFAKPAWQIETGAAGMASTVPADGSRDVPDIALDAAAIHDPLLFCDQGSCTNGFRNSTGSLFVGGGTSFDSQIFGGMLALIEQKVGPSLSNGPRLGLVTPVLYALGNNATYYNNTSTSVFHDVTGGNNSNPCSTGTPGCPNGGSIGYNAGTGYDLATGWGSVDLNNLANAWSWGAAHPTGVASLIGTAVSTTALATSPACTPSAIQGGPCTQSVAAGSSITLTATVTGATTTPTGTVQFYANNVAVGSSVGLTSGVANYTYNATCLNLGQQSISAVYSGDTTYAGSKAPAPLSGAAGRTGGANVTSNGTVTTNPLIVTVTTNSCPDFSLAPSGTSTSTAAITATPPNAAINVAAGGTIPPITLTVTPVNGLTGTVNFTAVVTSTTSGNRPTIQLSPSSMTFSASSSASQTTTLSLSGIYARLNQPALLSPSRSGSHPWYAAESGIAVAGLLVIFLPRRRGLGGLLIAVLSISLVAGIGGCGGSSSSSSSGGSTITNPYIGTYTITVTATYTNSSQTITHGSTLTYNIQ